MALYKKEGSPYWWADMRVAGVRHRVSTKQTSKAKAATAETAMLSRLSSGEITFVRRKTPTINEYSKRFIAQVESSRLEPKSVDDYRNGVRLLSNSNIWCLRIDAVTKARTEALDIPGSGSNVNCALRTLRRMLSLALEDGLINRIPRIKLAKEHKRERTIAADEEMRLLAAAPKNLRDAFLLVLDAGMRPGEVARLRWEEVDLVRRVIFVARGKSKAARRHLPMSKRVYAMLIERAKKGGVFVFPSRVKKCKGKAMLPASISRTFTRLKRKLKLSDEIVLYSARHTFATDFLGATGDLAKTSKTIGHTSISMTGRYLHPEVASLGEIMDARNLERHNLGHSEITVQ